ncbi:glucose-6-phosphate isomerase [Acholeplasma equifetale]|uniref:glucose-6-phosphate isomerase n=1 Tax=Acholeplasma equifetale TaxID=264634 RepID=UPI00138AD95A|nr:glucose-6-phosphate isomerase [Acholeplasma equifetale]
MALKISTKDANIFLNEKVTHLQSKVNEIHEMIKNKSGKGNDFLGWLDLPVSYDKEELDRIYKLKEQFKDLDCLVVVGIGGSYLGAKAGLEFLQTPFKKSKPEIIFAGQNLSSNYLKNLLKYLNKKNYAINVISKSGTTTEPAIAFRLLKQHIENKYGLEEARKRIFATTDKARGALYQLALNEGYEKFVIPDDVGGRFSVLTAVGLLPFVFKGVDVKGMLEGAKDAYLDAQTPDLKKNKAYLYAVTRYLLYKEGKQVEYLVNYEPRLAFFAEWWKQLYGESEGKEHKGLLVSSASFTTDLHSLGQQIQDGLRIIFETVIQVKKNDKLLIPYDEKDLDKLNYLYNKEVSYVNEQALIGTKMAHVDGGVPNILITIDKLDAYHFGYLVYFFEIACAMSAYLLDVNPFDQPGVEAYKKNMFKLLGKK